MINKPSMSEIDKVLQTTIEGNVDTGGGFFNSGNIDTGGGDFIVQSPRQPTPVSLRQMFAPLIESRIRLFGGREDVITIIDQWIVDHHAGYLLITAPAGFGKTALVSKLINDSSHPIAYHFFTPLYGDDSLSERSFLENVVQQISAWHGDNQQQPEHVDSLRAQYQQLIEKPLDRAHVLILDGLDEIPNWDITPYVSRALPQNVFVILTVRDIGKDWAKEYKLPRDQVTFLPLGGMSRDEVIQVFRAAGGSATLLIDNPDLADQIVKIAAFQTDPQLGADPFYVRFLAEDAYEGRLTAENLANQPQGLEAYLDAWWQGMKSVANEEPIKDLFGTLTIALHPISRVDLEAINPSLVDEWNANYFDDIIQRAHLQKV